MLLVEDASSPIPGPSARPRPGVLTPASASSLNTGPAPGLPSSGKKRKRDPEAGRTCPRDPFVIKPYPASTSSCSHTLKPISLLPRSSLPLSFLDVNGTATISPSKLSGRFVRASIPCLEENTSDEKKEPSPTVLTAISDSDQSLYAIERVQTDVHAICKLGSWVNLEHIHALRQACSSPRPIKRSALIRRTPDHTWWQDAVLDMPLPIAAPSLQEKVAGRQGIFRLSLDRPRQKSPKRKQTLPEKLESNDKTDKVSPDPHEPSAEKHDNNLRTDPHVDSGISSPNADEVLQMVRTQYLETLYVSRTSLAYFAKGPMSRARACFSAETGNPLDPAVLIGYLQGSVLPFPQMDKKYRDSLPAIVSSLPPADLSDDDDNWRAALAPRRKRKLSKKKPGRDGLYPQETVYVTRWWNLGDTDSKDAPPNEGFDDQVKRRIAALRVRETELQMILVLEIIALQSIPPEPVTTGNITTSDSKQENEARHKMLSSKKSPDLNMALELLVDRLCIWQSVSVDECSFNSEKATLAKAPAKPEPGKEGDDKGGVSGNENDLLRAFCIEVIIPFYANKLPEKCAAISHKLGGFPMASPPPISTSRPEQKAKPVKAAAKKTPRTLQRVMTDEKLSLSRQKAFPPSLRRSVTAPAVPGLKREDSETPLSAIPTIQASRGGVLNSKRFSQREVDLPSAVRSKDRHKRSDSLQGELEEAIAALKKPNRTLAVKEYVASSEHRTLAGDRATKKTRMARKRSNANPARGVQVMATPKVSRTKNMFAAEAASKPTEQLQNASEVASSPCIPSSGVRARPTLGGPVESLRVSCSTLRPFGVTKKGSIAETPSRGPSRTLFGLKGQTHLMVPTASSVTCSTPIARSSLEKASPGPTKSENFTSVPGLVGTSQLETPTKRPIGRSVFGVIDADDEQPQKTFGPAHGSLFRTSEMNLVQTTPVRRQMTADTSIYDRLGWNDTDDLV